MRIAPSMSPARIPWLATPSTYLFKALFNADLLDEDFSQADLSGADLSRANVMMTKLGDLDLSGLKGLESIIHLGPSTIGIDTFYRSKDKIPDVFLRGAGVPDSFITYAKSLAGSAIEFCSCFISYSTEDQEFADRLHADLQAKSVRCWFAPHDIKAGRKLHEQIDEAIRSNRPFEGHSIICR